MVLAEVAAGKEGSVGIVVFPFAVGFVVFVVLAVHQASIFIVGLLRNALLLVLFPFEGLHQLGLAVAIGGYHLVFLPRTSGYCQHSHCRNEQYSGVFFHFYNCIVYGTYLYLVQYRHVMSKRQR